MIHSADHYDMKAGDYVLVHREKKNRWVEPYRDDRIEEKRGLITDGKYCRPVNVCQLLPHTLKERDLELKRLLKRPAELQSFHEINISEVFYPSNERARTEQCIDAIASEVKELLERSVFKCMKKKNVPNGPNILTTRMVFAVKNIGTEKEKYKAHLAAHGHKDRDRHNCIQNSPPGRPISLRMLLTSTSIKKFRTWATDIIQEFVQSFDLTREIYVNPRP